MTSGAAPDPNGAVMIDSMHRAIEERRKVDPFAGVTIAGQAVFDHLVRRLKNDRGVQIELLATAIGVLAGRACFIAAVTDAQSDAPQLPFSADDTVFTDKSGQRYFFSEGTNYPLCRAQYSFWAYIGGILHQEGVEIPDLVEMVRWNAGLVGHPEYGIPRYAPGTGVSATPRELLALWPAAQYMVTQALIRPAEWPMAYGIAAQHMLKMAKGQFDLTTLARITFESANGMSKLAIPVTPADLEVASS